MPAELIAKTAKLLEHVDDALAQLSEDEVPSDRRAADTTDTAAV